MRTGRKIEYNEQREIEPKYAEAYLCIVGTIEYTHTRIHN